MVGQTWAKPLAKATLLLIFVVGPVSCACGQQPPVTGGSLSGKLTDIHSTPLENMTVILHNAGTGIQVQTMTARGGRYTFTNLAEGEYTLTATGLQGTGRVDGIFVATGHEARVQTALDFESNDPQITLRRDAVEASLALSESLPLRLRTLQTSQAPVFTATDTTANNASVLLPTQIPVVLPLNETKTQPPVAIAASMMASFSFKRKPFGS